MQHQIYDCKSKNVTLVEMTGDESALHRAMQDAEAVRVAAQAEADATRAASIDAIRAHAQANPTDPVALLAQALGVL